MPTCTYTFRRGASKGSQCGRTCKDAFCTVHVTKVLDVQQFPTHIMESIVGAIADKTDKLTFARLCNLGATCREYRGIVNDRCETIYKNMAIDDEKRAILAPLSAKRRLHLLLESGCTRCAAPRITKIHWPFPLRLCGRCIHVLTVPDYLLRSRYYVSEACIAQVERFIPCTGWSYYYGDTTYRSFLVSDIEAVLGCSLAHMEATIEARSMKHIIEIAESIGFGVTASNIMDTCTQLLSTSKFPDKDDVIADYFQKVALKYLHDRKYTMSYFSEAHLEARYVDNATRYQAFLDRMESSKAELEETKKRQDFDSLKSSLRHALTFLLHKERYFGPVHLNEAIGTALEDTTSLDELKAIEGDLRERVEAFTKKHKLLLPFRDKDAVRMIGNILFYPATQLETRSLQGFARDWQSARRINSSVSVSGINTWEKLVDYINQN